MDVIRSGNKYLHILAVYNRRVGLPSIFVSSIVGAILLATYSYLNLSIYGTPIGLLITLLLGFGFLSTLLILFDFLAMNYLFDRVLKKYYKQGLPYASLVGIEAINDVSIRETQYAIVLCASSTASLIMFLFGIINPEIIFIYLSMGSALITFGFSIIKREHVLDPDEMLRLYKPDTFPTILNTDIFLETFIDPFNRLKFREYVDELSQNLKKEYSTGDALSKITILLLQNIYGALRIEDVKKEVSEFLQKKEYIKKLEQHENFSFDRLKIILGKAKKIIPEFTNLLDRLFVSLLDDLPKIKSDQFYIDAEVSLEKKKGQIGRCFILLYNNLPDKSQTYTVNYNSLSVAPMTSEVSFTLLPRDFDLPSDDTLPVYSDSRSDSQQSVKNGDIVGLMSRLMDNCRIVWFSFEIRENGIKPIVVTVKDKETGQTVFGRTFLLEASYNIPDIVLKVLGTLSLFFGVFLPIARMLNLPV